MKPLALFIALFAISAALASPPARAADQTTDQRRQLVLATPLGEGKFTDYLTQVYKILGERSGIDFTILEVPKKRALVSTNLGKDYDGVTARIQGLEKLGYPNLLIVNSPLVTVEHVLFSTKENLARDPSGLIQDSIQANYVIGFLRGSKKSEALLEQLPEKNKHRFNRAGEAFRWLKMGRIKAFIGGPGMVSRNLLKAEYASSGIREIAILSKTPLFPYLHKRHADLIPRITETLNSMFSDGTLANIRRMVE